MHKPSLPDCWPLHNLRCIGNWEIAGIRNKGFLTSRHSFWGGHRTARKAVLALLLQIMCVTITAQQYVYLPGHSWTQCFDHLLIVKDRMIINRDVISGVVDGETGKNQWLSFWHHVIYQHNFAHCTVAFAVWLLLTAWQSLAKVPFCSMYILACIAYIFIEHTE